MSSISSRTRSLNRLLVGMVVSASAGCAGNIVQLPSGRAAGEWQVRLPDSRSAVADLAMGRGGSSERAASWFDGSPDDLYNSQPRVADAGVKRPRSTERRKTGTAVRHVDPAPHPEQPQQQEQPKANVPSSVAPVEYALADTSGRERYAEREHSSQQQQRFIGGDRVIVIGVSTLVIVLLVVLLILVIL